MYFRKSVDGRVEDEWGQERSQGEKGIGEKKERKKNSTSQTELTNLAFCGVSEWETFYETSSVTLATRTPSRDELEHCCSPEARVGGKGFIPKEWTPSKGLRTVVGTGGNFAGHSH